MSFESALHMQMVRQIVREVGERHGSLYSLTIYADLPEFGRNKPCRIGRYVPDVIASDVPETCRILGEAKTPADCETERSACQMVAFLRDLAAGPNAFFYLAVPWTYAGRAANLLTSWVESAGAEAVRTTVLRRI